MINSRPLTYVCDDSEGINYNLCPSHLINGRRVANIPNIGYFEIISTNESLTRRAKHQRMLLNHFTNHWRKQYLLGLREVNSVKVRSTQERSVDVGDVVILYNEFSKRAFWRLGIVKELLPGKDGLIRAAVVKVINSERPKLLRRSVQHLIPLEVKSNIEANNPNEEAIQKSNSDDATRVQRRIAAIAGEQKRRSNCN